MRPKTKFALKVAGASAAGGLVGAVIWTLIRRGQRFGMPLPAGLNKVASGWAAARTIGARTGIHGALDFNTPIGTPVYAIAGGTVLSARKGNPQTGNFVTVKHRGGLISRYIHLDRVLVQAGQRVHRGEKIALSGDTGSRGYPHLHLDIQACGGAIDNYKRKYGWPTTTATPLLITVEGCIPVPAEPLVPVDGYRSRVVASAQRYGIQLYA